MKNKVAIVIILIALATFFIQRQFKYPSEWDQIHAGMSRQEVYDLIGPGGGEWPGWKGPFWFDRGMIVWHELRLSMMGDRVIAVHINRYWGEHHPLGVVRSESTNPQQR
jgi:hypothetical protein